MTTEEVIKVNGATKKALFDKLPFGLANDLWFYIHLGNYGNTVCDFQVDPKYPLSFKLKFARDGAELFSIDFNGKYDMWNGLIDTLRSNAHKILGVE